MDIGNKRSLEKEPKEKKKAKKKKKSFLFFLKLYYINSRGGQILKMIFTYA
jgi:hypothetical protein